MKNYKPYTPSRRFMVGYDFSPLTTDVPYKGLLRPLKKTGGRNNKGKTTMRFRGGGHKRRYRLVDFRRTDKKDIPGKVEHVEYDPNRTSWIVLVLYADGERRYHLAPKGVKQGQQIICSDSAPIEAGNRKQLKDIPQGVNVYNLEVIPGTKGKLIKSAGSFATVTGYDEAQGLVYIKLPSGEIRKFHQDCYATIGIVSNDQHKNIVLGKAGRSRWLGKKPRNRGKSMNPRDHAHGGGEAGTSLGMIAPKSFAGKVVPHGKKTRKKKKRSDKFIVSRRK